ncbi:MAG: hypothetical protein H6711_10910 [Myxococcales bacterium]|nr:hypothetical protein [Myxococcales bacterium]
MSGDAEVRGAATGSASDALRELEVRLAAPLDAATCARLVALARALPGRQRAIVAHLAGARRSPAIDALIELSPGLPGVVEGVYHALRLGLTRELGERPAPEHLALEFRASRAHDFEGLLTHAEAAFPEHLERLEIDGKPWHRLALWGPLEGRHGLRRVLLEHGGDLVYLHRKLARLRGARLWLNGWRFESDGAWTVAHQVHLVQAWIDHATQLAS